MNEELTKEPFARMHQVIVVLSAFSLIGLIVLCTLFVPYVIFRFGFGFSL